MSQSSRLRWSSHRVGARAKPFFDLGGHFWLHVLAVCVHSVKTHGAGLTVLEEEVLRGLSTGLAARQGRERVDQLGRRVHGAARSAVVAVLVFGVAARALAFDEAVRQEHVLSGSKNCSMVRVSMKPAFFRFR